MSRMVIDDKVREKYDKNFDPKHFIETFYEELQPYDKVTLEKLQEAFTPGKLQGSIKRFIDIGCGPVPHRLSAASKICDTLYYSDYSAINRQAIEDWLRRTVPDPRFNNVFQYCAKLEGFGNLEQGAIEIENRIKSKVKGVLPVNVLNPEPLGVLDHLFDVAFTGGCLEAACDSYDSYVKALMNIGSILRPGGYLLILGFTNGDFYTVNDIEFPSFNQNVETVAKALTDAAFKILEVGPGIIVEKDEYLTDSNATGTLNALAQKI